MNRRKRGSFRRGSKTSNYLDVMRDRASIAQETAELERALQVTELAMAAAPYVTAALKSRGGVA
jgi:hypothetical protein